LGWRLKAVTPVAFLPQGGRGTSEMRARRFAKNSRKNGMHSLLRHTAIFVAYATARIIVYGKTAIYFSRWLGRGHPILLFASCRLCAKSTLRDYQRRH